MQYRDVARIMSQYGNPEHEQPVTWAAKIPPEAVAPFETVFAQMGITRSEAIRRGLVLLYEKSLEVEVQSNGAH